jgi:hypothetical protein
MSIFVVVGEIEKNIRMMELEWSRVLGQILVLVHNRNRDPSALLHYFYFRQLNTSWNLLIVSDVAKFGYQSTGELSRIE